MKIIVYIILLYFIGALAFLGSTTLLSLFHYILLGIGGVSFIIYYSKHKWDNVATCIFLYSVVFPIYGAYKSNEIFGQSFFMGLASLRYLSMILLAYFLLLIKYDYQKLISQINSINLVVAIISIIAILILQIPPTKLYNLMASNNILGQGQTGESAGVDGANIRGIRFTACSAYMIFSLIYYQLAVLKFGTRKNWYSFLILIIYILFVNKGRQPIAVMGIIYLLYFLSLKGFNLKKLCMIIVPVIGGITLIYLDPTILGRFTTVLEGEQSKDFSTLARIKEVDQIMPYIMDNLLMGIGNLSAHFHNGGFQSLFGKHFFLSDIGVFGTMARGGLLLIIIYISLYYCLFKRIKSLAPNFTKIFMKYMLFAFGVLLVAFYNDILFEEGSAFFAFTFYPLFSFRNSNLYINTIYK